MKILVDGMPRDLGGIGTLLINLAHYNQKMGNKERLIFEFLIPSGSAYKQVLEKDGYKCFEVPKVCTGAYRKCIQNVFAQNRYDYVWINNTSKVNIDLPRIAKKSGAKIIAHSHGVSTEAQGIKRVVFSILEKCRGREYCNLIDIPFACSTASADYFYPAALRNKCQILSNGIEVEKFAFCADDRKAIRDELKISENDVLIGTVGRLTKIKNYPFLVELMPQLPENYKLVLLGDGEDEDMLKELVRKEQLHERVFLLGKKQDVAPYLSAMDIFAMPSLYEGMPFSLVEAQANGLKCLVSTEVAREVKIIDSVEFLRLDCQNDWIGAIRSELPDFSRRISAAQEVISAGYSIGNSYRMFLEAVSWPDE